MAYGLTGKLGGAFATAEYLHGGAELGIQTILDHMLVLGMMAYSGGGAYGAHLIVYSTNSNTISQHTMSNSSSFFLILKFSTPSL